MWRDFPEEIALMAGCEVLIYDRLGHGKSDSLPSSSVDTKYLHTESFKFLPAVLSHCDVECCIFLGHSDGGTIALLFSSKYPKLVKGIITEAAHVFVENINIKGVKNTVDNYNTSNFKSNLSKYHGSKVNLMFWRWANTWLSSEFADWNIEKSLNKIKCPVLVVQGEDDEYGTVKQVKSIAGKVGDYSEWLLIPNCRHVPHHQARNIVTSEVSRFILDHCLQKIL